MVVGDHDAQRSATRLAGLDARTCGSGQDRPHQRAADDATPYDTLPAQLGGPLPHATRAGPAERPLSRAGPAVVTAVSSRVGVRLQAYPADVGRRAGCRW